ncbi:MAG TPA: hypothetical protein VIO32_03360 [Candidatus Baltobacteraceae bacterium]
MDVLERIRAFIAGFAGYAEPEVRRISDEQIRAFVGEALAALPAVEIEQLEEQERLYYDRVLLRCEFINQEIFRAFDSGATAGRIDATLAADADVVHAAAELRKITGATLNGALVRLHDALDKRDAAMQSA